ncbi:carbohydrate kinase [Halarchaeum grantii]|uniref:Carbohydrate kinase n=1 Tax=Halarchaeum grantii TaxID=1193105 RepID=A0A830F134_9EURY|nr:rhamnulokinase family protein [Halarchaeum grantii]GGL44743.1 carbohydrate kinase [Halarchaeum grantii]
MRHVAVDIGANGGTVYAGGRDGDAFAVEEVARFDNRPVERDGRHVWDVEGLLADVRAGVRAARETGPVDTVGIDTWGLDFGLLRDGDLLRAPYAYRDPAVSSTRDAILECVEPRMLFESTGINHWNTPNTLWQYHYLAREERDLLERADRLLMMPQLLTYLLGGAPVVEETVASTTQMFDPVSRAWTGGLLETLGLPTDLLPPVEPAGTRVGTYDPVEPWADPPALVLPASHDTAAAVAGLPLTDESRAFLNTGTWFLGGVELETPDRSQRAFAGGISNELGVDGTVRFLRNVTGFFLLEECRVAWRERGEPVDYETLLDAAREAEAFGPLVDPDADAFDITGSMPAQLRSYCEATGQPVPDDRGELVRCVVESLVAKTAVTLEDVFETAEVDPDAVHVGGGGVENELFCRMLADALDRRVEAGPVEATAIGNLLTQAMAADTVDSLDSGRRLVADSVAVTTYEPTADGAWADALEQMRRLEGDAQRTV